MKVTLITFDGFVKQMNHPSPGFPVIRIPGRGRKARFETDVFDPTTDLSFTVRDFYQVSGTNVYEER